MSSTGSHDGDRPVVDAAQRGVRLPVVAEPKGHHRQPARRDEPRAGRRTRRRRKGQLVPGAPADMFWALGLGNQIVQVDPGIEDGRRPARDREARPKPPTFGPAEASRVVTEAVTDAAKRPSPNRRQFLHARCGWPRRVTLAGVAAGCSDTGDDADRATCGRRRPRRPPPRSGNRPERDRARRVPRGLPTRHDGAHDADVRGAVRRQPAVRAAADSRTRRRTSSSRPTTTRSTHSRCSTSATVRTC